VSGLVRLAMASMLRVARVGGGMLPYPALAPGLTAIVTRPLCSAVSSRSGVATNIASFASTASITECNALGREIERVRLNKAKAVVRPHPQGRSSRTS
jgi:hypothetical protein